VEWHWVFPPLLWPVFGLAALLVALAVLAFDVWMLVDAIQRPAEEYSSPEAKTWWIVGLVVGLATGLPAIAVAIAYYVVVRRPALAGRSRPAAGGVTGRPGPGAGAVTAAAGPGPAAPPPTGVASPPPTAPAATCRSCGTALLAGARYCHSCGAPTRPEGP
jgi:hypothetical protein